MKVERQKAKPTFDPIVITLETEKEAELLWHLLDSAPAIPFLDYIHTRQKKYDGLLKSDMWGALHRIFNPLRDC